MNIIKEIQQLKKRVNALYCNLIGAGGVIEIDPTVPDYVKAITQDDIINWETTTDAEVIITENTEFATINDSQKIFNKNISEHILTYSDPNKANINADNILNNNVYLWITALDLYTKSDIDSKFYNNSTETVTEINKPTLLNNILTIKYKGEDGVVQTQTVDLSTLVTVDIHIEDAVYDPANNIITITDTEGNNYNVNLSEFSILKTVTAQGITKLIQEGETKLEVSKVGTTGKYADIIEKPFFLEVPESVGTWVIHVSDLGNYYYVDANEFGKNIANSHLQTTQQGALTQNYDFKWTYGDRTLTLGTDSTNTEGGYSSFMSFAKYLIRANVSNPTLGSNTYFNLNLNQAELRVHETGIQIWNDRIELLNASTLLINRLTDKSNDSTYNKLLGINSAGNVAKVDGKTAFKGFLSALNPTEALEIAQILNGGVGSIGGISVNIINPDTIEKLDENQYVVLQGANLWINQNTGSIEILNLDGSVVAVVPPSQVISNSTTPTLLTFYFNFKNLLVGDYKLKIVSGAKTYITTNNISLVQNIIYKDLNLLTWSAVFESGYENDVSYGYGAQAVIKNTKQTRINSINPIISLKSEKIFNRGEDWVLEFTCNYLSAYSPAPNTQKTIIGITNSNAVNSLLYNSIANSYYFSRGDQGQAGVQVTANVIGSQVFIGPVQVITKIVKKSNLLRITDNFGNIITQTISNNLDYSMLLQMPDRINNAEVASVIITKAYTY